MLTSGLPDTVDNAENLARFVYSESHFNANGPKPSAYLPSSDGETSVFRHGPETPEALWALNLRQCKLYGAAIVQTHEARAVGLEVIADEPPRRHAVIKGWPVNADDPILEKAKRKELALAIASRAIFLKCDLPPDATLAQ
jgi:hypothetical protein